MRFKKLEIFGFKSFAEKTKIEFEPGVTAIVGPNGCGKSNIADAIKWVLGEQRPTALRGSSMGDVIFNGTNEREPINIAEVSLTLSNESKTLSIEYDEVTVTRRIYRSGESEYFLNKTKVRLKDIHDLFHGTGVGKAAYSLIEQGKMDLILSTRPEDRRYIFEEAAGITKYKSKKEEALRKLEHTVNNLQRVNDIVSEVSRQIKSIERQAHKAERYKEKLEELKAIEVKSSYRNYLQFKNEGQLTYSKKEQFKEKESSLLSSMSEIENTVQSDRNKLEALEERFSGLQTEKINSIGAIENNNSRIDMNHERIKELRDKIKILDKQKESINKKINDLTRQIEAGRLELEQIKDGVTEKEKISEEKESFLASLNLEIEESSNLIKENKPKIINLVNDETKLNNELAEIKANLQNVNARLKRLKTERNNVEVEREKISGRYSELQLKKEELLNVLSNLKKEEEESREIIQEEEKDLIALKDKVAAVNHNLASLESRLNFLKDLKERFEGYSKAVKSILIEAKENKLPFRGILDSAANLIKVKEGYELAVEISLGADAQAILIETQEQAQEAINFLKVNKLGWVKFLPISNSISHQSSCNESILLANKGLKPLSEVIDTEPDCKDVISSLFSKIYLVEDINRARDFLRDAGKDNPDIKFITPAGEMLTSNFIAGGSYLLREESSIIGRDVKIGRVENEYQDLKKEKLKLEDVLGKQDAKLKELKEENKGLREAIYQEEMKKINIQSKLNAIEEDMKKFEDEVALVDSEIEESESLRDNFLKKQIDFELNLNNIRQSNNESQSIIVLNQQSVDEKSRQIKEVLIEVTQVKTELSSIDKLYSNKLESCKLFESSIEEANNSFQAIEEEIKVSLERIKQLEEQVGQLSSNNNLLAGEKKTLENKISDLSGQKETALRVIREQGLKLKERQIELDKIRDNLYAFETKKTEYSLRLENLKDKIFTTYSVNLDEIELEIEDNVDVSKTEEDISKLKKQLDSMGNVNLVAIDEHQELRERFDFLTHQRQDLEEAKESLKKTIQKINHTTIKMFKETFEMIAKTFEEFFKLLFGGGSAKLFLIDENNVLESGIEIIARPPGKKLQNITLMSGGEKAMCAIALLFAVFKVKPSPFCVLDEIDASLDEANVDRFSKVLKDFIKTSQFIIITHNKKTIGMADVMYGVTMQETGISQIVSVKFVEDKEKEAKEVVEVS